MSRFAVLTDAAIALVADLGMRGLTHRAVDTRAGLPPGTTSAYFRTRKALIEALVRRLADLDRADLEQNALPAGDAPPADLPGPRRRSAHRLPPDQPPAFQLGPDDLDRLAAQIAAVMDGWLTTGRTRTLARYACLLEATHHPELRTILQHGTAYRTQARALLAAAGAADPQQASTHFVACVDGLLFDRLAGAGALTAPTPGTAGSRADLTAAVRMLLAAATHPPDR